jgi:hypothetical protein
MNAWPREIRDEEAIARGICSPFHVRNGKLKPDAYWPPNDTDEVSVMRACWIGADACKARAKSLEDVSKNKIYTGLAILSAQQIRSSGASLVDTREIFEGHADIKHGIVPSKGEPPPPEQLHVLRQRTKALAIIANYYPDPEPNGPKWTGSRLYYKSTPKRRNGSGA